MRTLFIIFIIVGLLSSCTLVRKMDIEQGNVMSPCMLDQLHPGMTRGQVIDIMGPPMVMNTFNENRMDYVYTFKKNHQCMCEQAVTLVFRGNILVGINRSL